MSRIVIRIMREYDLEVVSELAMLANPQAKKQEYRKFIIDELRGNPELSFVALDGEEVVGYVQGDIRGSMAKLEDLAVAKEYQRKGIGGQLLNAELEVFKRKGSKMVVAEVHYKNAEAIPFY